MNTKPGSYHLGVPEKRDLEQCERRWTRLHVDMPIRVLARKRDCLYIVNGRGTEVSEDAVTLYAALELDIGDRVEIEFTDPDSGPPLRIRAVVRKREGYAYGLQPFSKVRHKLLCEDVSQHWVAASDLGSKL